MYWTEGWLKLQTWEKDGVKSNKGVRESRGVIKQGRMRVISDKSSSAAPSS